ncbi:MAG TPA: hydroxymethylglutaryl-CoA reductase [Candidatus Polarisedimenticolaceae bacterium]|nr:hydroxymethylglutaryl-CoA reductase [Candidatus Polarisedimenticolaceae bacterium]
MKIPSLILRQLYTFGSLENSLAVVRFSLKNRLSDATLTGLTEVRFDDDPVPLDLVSIDLGDGQTVAATAVSEHNPVVFPLRKTVEITAARAPLSSGPHRLKLGFVAKPFGKLELSVQDSIADEKPPRVSVPYRKDNDYSTAAIAERQRFVERFSGIKPQHLWQYSFDPQATRGNVENFTGVAQVPIGFAGPLRVNGEHAKGDFLVPLATSEGTLVASYNRGIKLVNESGGVTCTVVSDRMQRAPVFVFDSAREARDFRGWVYQHFEEIRDAAEATSRVAKLDDIDTYLSNRFAFLRFNYSTGDAAGQNMVGRATFAACSWILERAPEVRKFYLESNLATDKKASQINVMRTRGKRVVAEATIARDTLVQLMRVEPESLFHHYNVSNVGALLSGANNNGCHSPNAITAMFIATGQDVANVSESSAGILYSELTPDKDLYISLTIPSLIVATHGGGTGLPTQRECLEIMGCTGRGTVNKLAEIVAGVALAGELSLASAISSLDWVSSHEQYGRNR